MRWGHRGPVFILSFLALIDEVRAGHDRLLCDLRFENLDLHCTLLSSAGRVMRQRNECRFENRLVACRRVHVTKLRVRCRRTPSGAYGDKCTISAVSPCADPVEPFARGLAPRFL